MTAVSILLIWVSIILCVSCFDMHENSKIIRNVSEKKSCNKFSRLNVPTKKILQSKRNFDKEEVNNNPKLVGEIKGEGNPTMMYSVFSLLVPWLYFMSVSVNIATLPKYVNWALNKGDTKVSEISSRVYGNISGIDAFFTFLSVNLIGCLSDLYGRRLFMFYSSFGLGTAFFIASKARDPLLFYMTSAIDGLSSCMLSQSQAYITDNQKFGSDLSVALSKFQGVAIGLAFMVGIPLGAWLIDNFSIQTPLYCAVAFCAINCFLITFLLPRSTNPVFNKEDSVQKKKKINWKDANPIGAAFMLGRNRQLLLGSLAYFFLHVAQSGLQAVWVNYLQHRLGWSTQQSGLTLVIVGFVVAIFPPLILPHLGATNSIKYLTLLHSLSIVYLASVSSTASVFLGMPFLAAGAASLPISLGYLTKQVSNHEYGAFQGAADTVRTVATCLAAPMMSSCFGYFISNGRNFPSGALYITASFSFIASVIFSLSCY